MAEKTNWYVITGGPCSGKTSVLQYLSFLGYRTIPEAARVLIDLERSKGRGTDEIREDEKSFQEKILKMKAEVEEKIPNEKTFFFDRGIPDSIAYYKFYNQDMKPLRNLVRKRIYKKVFLLKQLPFTNDYGRIEDENTAKKINNLIYDAYSSLGYDVIEVPVKPVEERADFILNRLETKHLKM